MHGITLIALVVTIVVLLILAGITISLVFSENGIIAKAREAANKTKEAVINEQTQMNEIADYMENMLNEIGGTTPDEPEGCPAEEFEKWNGTSDEKVNAVQSTDTTPIAVPVPKGYTASKVTGETTVEDGFVIYEGEEEVNDTNKETAQTTRNQFVWVPVENPSEMYGRDENCKKWGKLYKFSSTGITANNWTEEDGVMSITATSGTGSYREPDIVTKYDGSDATDDSSYFTSTIGDMTGEEFKAQLEEEFNSMIASVEKYGGFYIGRYETGNLSQEEAVVVKNNSDINKQTWYTMYNKSKGVAANSSVTTSMIWGCQWDAVMRWMYNSGDAEKKTYTYASTGKGNYYGTNGNKTIPTGSNDAYTVNNIYDMAGNVYDRTIEAINTNVRVTRGGYFGSGSDRPASNRYDLDPMYSFSDFGSRLALYM